MDFYSGKQPNLIGPIMKSTVCKVMKRPVINNTVSDKVTTYAYNLYGGYISENKLIIFILLVFIAFLIYRYYNKKTTPKIKKESSLTEENINLINQIKSYQNKNLAMTAQLEMTKHEYEHEQDSELDSLPTNMPETSPMYGKQKQITESNTAAYDYNIQNPLGWSNNVNSNMQNVMEFQTRNNNINNLTDTLKFSPDFIKSNSLDYNLDPPYAQDF